MRIYKIQLPLSSNVSNPKGLAYSKKQDLMIEIPVTEELKKFFQDNGGEHCFKLYVYAQLDLSKENNVFNIDRIAPEQDW